MKPHCQIIFLTEIKNLLNAIFTRIIFIILYANIIKDTCYLVFKLISQDHFESTQQVLAILGLLVTVHFLLQQ